MNANLDLMREIERETALNNQGQFAESPGSFDNSPAPHLNGSPSDMLKLMRKIEAEADQGQPVDLSRPLIPSAEDSFSAEQPIPVQGSKMAASPSSVLDMMKRIEAEANGEAPPNQFDPLSGIKSATAKIKAAGLPRWTRPSKGWAANPMRPKRPAGTADDQSEIKDLSAAIEAYESDNDWWSRLKQRAEASKLNFQNMIEGRGAAWDHADIQAVKSEIEPSIKFLNEVLEQSTKSPELRKLYARKIESTTQHINRKLYDIEQNWREIGKAESSIRERDRQLSQIPQNPAAIASLGAKTANEAWEYFKQDPIAYLATLGIQVAPQAVTNAGISAIGGLVGGPFGFAAASGGTDSQFEMGAAFLEELRRFGADPMNPATWREVLEKHGDEIQVKARKAAATIGVASAISGGVAAKLPGTIGRRIAFNTGLQPGINAAGEATKQKIVRGEVTEPGQVMAEGFGAGMFAPVEVGAAALSTRQGRADNAPPPVGPGTPPAAPEIDPIPPVVNQAAARPEAQNLPVPNVPPTPDGQMPTRTVTLKSGRQMQWRGPMDLVTWLRAQGGLRDAGELSALGIDNRSRGKMDFARNEPWLGGLMRKDGMDLDDAALAAWEAGFFPDFVERPMPNDLLDAISETHSGLARRFTQDDQRMIADFEDLNLDIDAEAARMGVDITGMPEQQARDALDVEASRQADLLEEIELNDLDNAAPIQGDILSASGLETMSVVDKPNTSDRAGNINLDKLESIEDINGVLVTTGKGINQSKVTRGRQSNAATEAMARDLKLSTDTLLQRRRGQAFNAEQALATRQLLVQSAEDLVRLAKTARGGADADLIAFQKALTRHVAIQEQVMGMTAEAGRALQSFKIVAQSEAARLKALGDMVNAAGGRNRIEETANSIAAIDDPAALNKFTRDSYKVTFRDKLYEYWINGLLSSPKTHAANFISNTIVAALQIPETALAATLSKVNRGNERIYLRESTSRLYGLVQGAKDGVFLAVKAFKTEQPSDPVMKLETEKYRSIKGMKGKLIRVPGRLLMASDEFFKAINANAEIHALAMRDGIAKGKRGDELATHIEETLREPSEAMQAKARSAARYRTFTQPLGRIGQSLMAARDRIPGGRLIMPFVRTPANIVKFAAERSPAGLLMSEVRANLSGRNGKVAQNDQAAKMMLGSTFSLWAVGMALEGDITGGGPEDWRQRQRMMAAGWQPYSIKIGDTFFSYRRIEPFNFLFGVAADLVELGQSLEDVDKDNWNFYERIAAKLTFGVAANVTSTTWMQGVSQAVEAMHRPESRGARFIQRLAGTVVPTALSHVARDGIGEMLPGDPVIREARDWLDEIRSRIPILSKELTARYTIWGEPMIREGGFGPDILSPINQRTDTNDPIKKEAVRLGVGPSPVNRRVLGVTLTPAERAEYQRLAGTMAYEVAGKVMRLPVYQRATDGQKVEILRKAFSAARRRATGMMKLANDKSILRRQKQAKEKARKHQDMKPPPSLKAPVTQLPDLPVVQPMGLL